MLTGGPIAATEAVRFPGPIPDATDVAVIGGGIAGIATALYLARAGVDGCAIVRGIMHADDPQAYCARVVTEFDRGRRALRSTP